MAEDAMLEKQAKFDQFVYRLRRRYADISQDGYTHIDAVADLLKEEGRAVVTEEYLTKLNA